MDRFIFVQVGKCDVEIHLTWYISQICQLEKFDNLLAFGSRSTFKRMWQWFCPCENLLALLVPTDTPRVKRKMSRLAGLFRWCEMLFDDSGWCNFIDLIDIFIEGWFYRQIARVFVSTQRSTRELISFFSLNFNECNFLIHLTSSITFISHRINVWWVKNR